MPLTRRLNVMRRVRCLARMGRAGFGALIGYKNIIRGLVFTFQFGVQYTFVPAEESIADLRSLDAGEMLIVLFNLNIGHAFQENSVPDGGGATR